MPERKETLEPPF